MTTRKTTMLVLGIAISAFLLWLALRNLEAAAFHDAMRQVDYRSVIALTACLLAFYWVRTYRWKLLLGHISNVTTRDLFGPVMIGYGANFLLPFQFGELARSFAARSRTNLPFMPLAFSIVVERLFDFLVILLALASALLLHRQLPGYLGSLGIVTALAVVALVAGALLLAARTEAVIGVVDRCLGILPDGLRRIVSQQLRSGAEGLRSLLNSRIVLAAVVVSLLQWLVFLACIWTALHAVGVTAGLPTLLLILALIVLGSSIPNAPGYLGSIQAGYVVALEATHGDAARGLAASIVFHLIYAVTAIGIGLYALRRASLDLRAVSELGSGAGDAAVPARTGKS